MTTRKLRHIEYLLATLLCVVLSACNGSLSTVTSLSQVEVPATFTHGKVMKAHDEDMSNWWVSWRDPALASLVDKVVEANVDLRAARARLAEANATHLIVDSQRHPTIGVAADVGGGAGEAKWPQLGFFPTKAKSLADNIEGVSASLEPDIFGAKADDSNAALKVALSMQEQLDGVRIIATTEAAQNYLEALSLEKRLLNLDKGLKALHKLVEYLKLRFETGQAQSYEVVAVEERLHNYESKRPTILTAVSVRRHHAAILAGLPPSADIVPRSSARLNLPKVPSSGLPSEVLERRPDVRARAAAVEAQVSRTNSARKEMLPRFRISFLGGNGRLQFAGIPGFQGTGGLLDLSVNLPVFTAGRIQANIEANDARLLETVAEYDKAVLRALEEVENAYTRRHAADQRQRNVNAALLASRRNRDITQEMYEVGRKDLADIIRAQIDLIEREDEVNEAELEAGLATLSLYAALGGAW
jgi:NodT family efflux transporter outer membrane factor (OMF) lipoprotein